MNATERWIREQVAQRCEGVLGEFELAKSKQNIAEKRFCAVAHELGFGWGCAGNVELDAIMRAVRKRLELKNARQFKLFNWVITVTREGKP